MLYFTAFLLSLTLILIATPALIRLAYRIDYVEKPKLDNDRKIHKEPKPYLASVGIFFVFWFVYFILVGQFSKKSLLIFLATCMIFMIGTLDDYRKIHNKDLGALPKLIVQLGSCSLVYFAEVKFSGFSNPLGQGFILLPGFLQFILTMLWLFGVTTVINFTDGLDGLAGGISCISACTLFVVALSKHNSVSALMAVTLVGICLGYLHYNKFPARILMGDAGATFLGFLLGVISLDGAFKQATTISILIPVLALGVPIFDNLFVVVKRMKHRVPIYVGDASQIHFRLIKKGYTHKQAVYLLYLVAIFLNLISISLLFVSWR